VAVPRPTEEGSGTLRASQEVVGDGEAGDASAEQLFDLLADGFHGHLFVALGEDFDGCPADGAELTPAVGPARLPFASPCTSWSVFMTCKTLE
jgi:hypothetical protein